MTAEEVEKHINDFSKASELAKSIGGANANEIQKSLALLAKIQKIEKERVSNFNKNRESLSKERDILLNDFTTFEQDILKKRKKVENELALLEKKRDTLLVPIKEREDAIQKREEVMKAQQEEVEERLKMCEINEDELKKKKKKADTESEKIKEESILLEQKKSLIDKNLKNAQKTSEYIEKEKKDFEKVRDAKMYEISEKEYLIYEKEKAIRNERQSIESEWKRIEEERARNEDMRKTLERAITRYGKTR